MSNGWKSHLPVAAGFAAGLLAVGAAAAKSAEAEAEARRKRKRLSETENLHARRSYVRGHHRLHHPRN